MCSTYYKNYKVYTNYQLETILAMKNIKIFTSEVCGQDTHMWILNTHI